MKIVSILASPKGKKGNTGQLLDAMLASIKKTGATVKQFDLAKTKIEPCTDCGLCHRTGDCPIKDDFPKIRNAMIRADGVIFASPNYIFNVTAQMKAFLDRCAGMLHCQVMNGTYTAAVVTSGGSGGEEVEAYLQRFARALGCWTVGGVTAEAGQLMNAEAKKERLQAAAELGLRLVEAIRVKKEYPEQEPEKTAFYERMKQLMIMRKDEWPFEYKYWVKMIRL